MRGLWKKMNGRWLLNPNFSKSVPTKKWGGGPGGRLVFYFYYLGWLLLARGHNSWIQVVLFPHPAGGSCGDGRDWFERVSSAGCRIDSSDIPNFDVYRFGISECIEYRPSIYIIPLWPGIQSPLGRWHEHQTGTISKCWISYRKFRCMEYRTAIYIIPPWPGIFPIVSVLSHFIEHVFCPLSSPGFFFFFFCVFFFLAIRWHSERNKCEDRNRTYIDLIFRLLV